MLVPGKILGNGYKISPIALEKLAFYFDHSLERNKLGLLCQDIRIDDKAWLAIFYREIIFLYQWAAKRMLLQQKVKLPDSPTGKTYNEVLSLLPRHGMAVHILRRAIPFAMCGLPVDVGFPDHLIKEGSEITNILSSAFCLSDLLFCKAQSSVKKINSVFKNKNCLILVTGKKHTVELIKSQVKGDVYGVTGRCALMIGHEPELLKKAYNTLRKHNFKGSCTKLKATFCLDYLNQIKDIQMKHFYGTTETVSAIDRLNPSFIYCLSDRISIPEFIRGYRVIKSDNQGVISTLVGFGSDPAFKWPGDFLI